MRADGMRIYLDTCSLNRPMDDKSQLRVALEARALVLEARGFKGFDALHIATAETGHVDYFCTCDDRLIKKVQAQPDVVTKVVSPLELVKELF